MKRGRAGTVTHDDERHGTTTLLAALNTLDGSAISTCQPRQRHGIWLKFLKLIDGRTPKHLSLHLIADNYATHRHHDVRNWLARHPRFIMHSPRPAHRGRTWSSGSSATSLTGAQTHRRHSFTSVAELELAIDLYAAHHNIDPKPFI